MRHRIFQLGLLVFMLLGIFSTPIAFDFSSIESQVVEFTLDNGMKFIVLPKHDAPIAYFRLIVNVGAANDPNDASGMAHMFEHMAFKGTKEVGTANYKNEKKWMDEEDRLFGLILDEKAKLGLADIARIAELEAELKSATDSAVQYIVTNEFGQIYEREGGVGMNAGTGYDMTIYIANYPANKLELWMAMESDRFINPVLREFYKEKNVITEERRMGIESSPQGKLTEEMRAASYKTHPYGQTVVGSMSDINNFYRPVALEYFNKFYIPNNMIVSIVGDVDPDEVKKLAKKYFGKIPYREKPQQVKTIEAPQVSQRTVIVKENAQPMYWSSFHIPSVNHPDMVALEALADYMGQGRTSLLYKSLVKEKKIAMGAQVFAGYPGNKYPTLFCIISIPSKDHTNAESDEEILKIIEQVKTELIPVEELEYIKARAKANLVNELSNLSGFASGLTFQLAYYEMVLGDWRKLFGSLDKINALTPADIQRVAKEYLDVDKRILALLENKDEE
ncbi:MAG: insulinase family protein [candidate division Zixibacteria bacterium]|nr:insulinase family protein [candidate division Zixibacteria bacterium]